MGSGGSRLDGSSRAPSRPHHRRRSRRRQPRFQRILSSVFICGAVTPSSNRPHEMEDDPAEKLVNSAEHGVEKIQFRAKSSVLPTSIGSELANCTLETGGGIERSTLTRENYYGEDVPRNVEVIDKGKSLFEDKELVFNPESFRSCRNNDASTSYEDEHFPQSESANSRESADAVNRETYAMEGNILQNYEASIQSSCPANDELGESLSDAVLVENSTSEVLVFHDCETSSSSALSVSPIQDTLEQPSPSGLNERDQIHRDGNALQVDVLSASSNTLSISPAELSNHEARHNGRRLFWDAFSRRGSRRNADSRSFIFTTDDSDGPNSHDRWLLDFNGEFFDDGVGGDSRSSGNSNQHATERWWHPSSEIWERFHDVGRSGTNRRIATCPSGIHPDGACSCGSMIRTEESGARASISRIVMLAEALFEVLDEIHRQPMSQSVSMSSLPAPESVVDSLPVKDHRKPEILENGDDVAQCYICLAEYEEGDKIRILPCHHEYHVSCVDKWLKEIHGVCPLCRGDVRV